MSVITLVLAAWTAVCWFSAPFPEPFLGLPFFRIDAAIPAALTLLWSFIALLIWRSRGGKEKTAAAIAALKKRRASVIILAVILVAHLCLSVVPVIDAAGDNDSDSALTGIAGYHIAAGLDRPMFCYGVHYVGTLIPHLTAPLHALFGMNPAFQRAVSTLFYLGFIILSYALARRLAGETAGLVAAAFAAVPPWFVSLQLRYTEFIEIAFWGTLSLLLLSRLLAKPRPDARGAFWFGVVLGVLFYVHPQAIYFIAAAVLLIFLRDRLFFLRAGWWAVFPGLLLGSTVFWIDAWFYNGDSLRYFFGVETGTTVGIVERVTANFSALLGHLPEFVGISSHHQPLPVIGIILPWLVLAAAVAALAFIVVRREPVVADAVHAQKDRAGLLWLLPVTALVIIVIFLASAKAYNNPAFRYLFPLWLLTPLLFSLPSGLARGPVTRVVALVLSLSVLVSLGWSQFQYIGHVGQENVRFQKWLDFCRERGITEFYGSFWLVYQTAFISREEIIGSSCYPFSYIPYQPYHWKIENGSGRPAFVFSEGIDKEAGKQADWLDRSLTFLGVRHLREKQDGRIVFHGFSERITPKQIIGIQLLNEAVIEAAGVQSVGAEGQPLPLRLVKFQVKNSGKTTWHTDGRNGFVELTLVNGGGEVIRRQPLMRDIAPDESFAWRVLLDDSKNVPLDALITLNEIVISREKKTYRLSFGDIGEAAPMPLSRLVHENSDKAGMPADFAFLSGWGSLEPAAEPIRWSGAASAEIGLIFGAARRRAPVVSLRLTPAHDPEFPMHQRLTVFLNDREIKQIDLPKAASVRLRLPADAVQAGLNRLKLVFAAVEPTWQHRRGFPIFRMRPRAAGLRAVFVEQ